MFIMNYDKLFSELVEMVRNGKPASLAIDEIWSKYKIPDGMYEYTKKLIFDEIAKGFGSLKSDPTKLAEMYSKSFDDLSLRKQIAKTSARMRQDLATQVNQSIKSLESLHETTRKMRNQAINMGADSGTAAEMGLRELYKSPWGEQARRLQRRVDSGIKRDQLRHSYENLIDKIENEASPEKMLKAREYAMKAKLKQHATRVVETERAQAISTMEVEKMANDSDVKLVKVELEERNHSITDICDSIAESDCGYGKGIYPLSKVPKPPFHPHCRS